MNTKLSKLKISPFLLLKQAAGSKYSIYKALNDIRIFCNKHCAGMQIAHDGQFLSNGDPYNNLIAHSINQLELRELQYCVCDFINSKVEVSDVAFINELTHQIQPSECDEEIDHHLLGLFHIANTINGSTKIRELLPFYMKRETGQKIQQFDQLPYRKLIKDAYLSESEIRIMLTNHLKYLFENDIVDLQANKLFMIRALDAFDVNSTQTVMNIAEGLNFTRIYGKPCFFVIKGKDKLHFGCVVLPLFEVNKYKILTISRPHDAVTIEILNYIRQLSFKFNLLRDDFFFSGQYITFDYKFNANFDVKIVLSAAKIVTHYALQESPQSMRDLLKDLDDWNNHPFSTIEDFINSIYNSNRFAQAVAIS